ncbi:MAG TPA: NAD+ synthase [Mycobacteriales bacterium]|nr:NAD+ synthase [Mycobacteriales bacterium]
MRRIRIALAQVNSTVGDLAANVETVVASCRDAAAHGASLVVFPELMVTGYPPEDLVLRSSFVDASRAAVEGLATRLAADGLGELAVVVGFVDRCAHAVPRVGRPAGEPQNSAALIHRGTVVGRYAKHHLPNYGVFDELRYFVPGDLFPVWRLHGVDVAITVCEDLWQDGGPIAVARTAGVGLILCINGSPYERNKDDVRLALNARRAREAGAVLAYVNLVAGQDELVFDGDSMIVDASGDLLARSPQFVADLLIADLDLPEANATFEGSVDTSDGTRIEVTRAIISTESIPTAEPSAAPIAPRLDDLAEVWAALVLATHDYVVKNGFRSVLVALSGGIDSAVVATIACDALGADAVHVVGMPSRYSSAGSVKDAEDLATRQGLHWSLIPIGDTVAAFEAAFAATDVGGLRGLAEENLQARVRGVTVMALSNECGHLVLTTGNKSELATGFSTLYGDSAGGFAPIKDVPKTLVWELARWRNAAAVQHGETPPIPEATIAKPPSAELAPGQLDADRLPEYDVLDAVLTDYVEADLDRRDLLAKGYDPATIERVIHLVDLAEYKRRQYPPGPKITPKNFGRDRRLPITNRWREATSE